MTPAGIISAIIIGAIIGVLGRLVVRGKQNISILVTIIVGIVAALLGTWLAGLVGVQTTTGSTGSSCSSRWSSPRSAWRSSPARVVVADAATLRAAHRRWAALVVPGCTPVPQDRR